MTATLDDLRAVERLVARLSPEKRKELVSNPLVAAELKKPWWPNSGPQTHAYESQASLLLYGGAAGGGKSVLLLGLAARDHHRSLIVRREAGELDGLIAESRKILDGRGSFNGSEKEWKFDGDKSLKFGGMKEADDWRKYAGRARDFIGFDEAAEFQEVQVSSILAWLRSTDKNQRCRAVLASNPPRSAEGEWIIRWFAPWLDPTCPVHADAGEIRWCITVGNELRWVDGPEPVTIDTEEYTPESRTFIPAKLEDNIDFDDGKYKAQLQNRPGPLRAQLLHGDFTAGQEDDDWQLIKTDWIVAAQARWKADGWRGLSMTAMGLDPAGGGRDSAELASRYGGWYAPMVSAKGEETADGSTTAATVTKHRKNGCPVVVDVGGGYAGSVITRFRDNEIRYARFDGGAPSHATAKGSGLKFVNKRAEAWWRMREELDPDQQGGSAIALPPDAELKADLAAPRWTLGPRGILIESKDDIRKRLGRSPGKGDACVMALSEGDKAAARSHFGSQGRAPQVNLGYAGQKRRRG